jgi:BirA family biotin operon repressor/biotin-[acetyl-CoA-carboxylase] ligase
MKPTTHYFAQTPSTQDAARQLLANGQAKIGDIVIADRQTNGRGRHGRTWISPIGGLYLTVILPSDPLISLKCGLAIVCALGANSVPAGLKWPNDVLVKGRKIAGVLVETDRAVCFVGVGLNLASAPLACATYVAAHTEDADRDRWGRTIADSLAAMASQAFDVDAYRSVCLTLGRRVRIDSSDPNKRIEGMAVVIDEMGRLVLNTASGTQAVSSGECLHLEEADGG